MMNVGYRPKGAIKLFWIMHTLARLFVIGSASLMRYVGYKLVAKKDKSAKS
jgi:hypothetical protein